MKLWHKVFLCTFLLFEAVFNAASIYLIEHNFNQNLQKEIDRALAEQQIIYSGLKTNWTYVDYINQKLGLTQEAVRDFLRNSSLQFTGYFDKKQAFIEIMDVNNDTVFSSFNQKVASPRQELEAPLSGNRKYIIRDIGEKSYLFVTNKLVLKDTAFKLSYISDISDVYKGKSSQYGLFLKLNAIITFILAIGLYFILWYLTRSIRRLTKSTQTIAAGDYSQRVEVLSGDEVGNLALNFNRMAQAVEDKVQELGRTAQNKQNFIDNLTHELKTPLTSIIGYADLLRATPYREEVFFKALNYIHSEGKRLESLSFSLMQLILIENENPGMKLESMPQLCSEIEEALRPRLTSAAIELVVTVQPFSLMVETDLFKMLCTNLLDNAIKASAEGSRIYLRGIVTEENGFILEVEDEGIGIPEKDIARVFEAFYMVNKAKSRSQHGAGLGLAICAEIVRLHRGKITIDSRLGQGTKVRILFPGICN